MRLVKVTIELRSTQAKDRVSKALTRNQTAARQARRNGTEVPFGPPVGGAKPAPFSASAMKAAFYASAFASYASPSGLAHEELGLIFGDAPEATKAAPVAPEAAPLSPAVEKFAADKVNESAAKIQAACRGNLARKQNERLARARKANMANKRSASLKRADSGFHHGAAMVMPT